MGRTGALLRCVFLHKARNASEKRGLSPTSAANRHKNPEVEGSWQTAPGSGSVPTQPGGGGARAGRKAPSAGTLSPHGHHVSGNFDRVHMLLSRHRVALPSSSGANLQNPISWLPSQRRERPGYPRPPQGSGRPRLEGLVDPGPGRATQGKRGSGAGGPAGGGGHTHQGPGRTAHAGAGPADSAPWGSACPAARLPVGAVCGEKGRFPFG